MNKIKYLLQFLIVIFIFSLFKILGFNLSSYLGGKLFQIIGPLFRSKKIIFSNIKKAFPEKKISEIERISSSMWNNYGRIFAEYMFIKNFRFGKLDSNISVEGKEILDEIKEKEQQVVFISGHFSNFEFMAMEIEKSGINTAAIYRPLNNLFLNIIMEKIRKKYICKNQIKKGIGGLRDVMTFCNKGYSIALMIDQRVSEGIKINFFNHEAYTTTIPAQLVKKFNIPIVPIYIERFEGTKFKMKINKPLNFSNNDSLESITEQLNKVLEKMILNKPDQWIWSHDRWK